MKRTATLALVLLMFAAPLHAQRWQPPGRGQPGLPSLAGVWYPNGNPDRPCQIVQPRPDGRALFINDQGSQAWAFVAPDHVWIPDWTDGVQQGLYGRIQGDRIIWPNGTYWSRNAFIR